MLTTQQLILIKDAVGSVGCVISADNVRFANTTLAFIDAELHRRQHGPLTLTEAVASGKPWREVGDIDVQFRLAPDDERVVEIGCGGDCGANLGCSSHRVRFQSRTPGGEWEGIDINDDFWYIGDWVANPNARFELVPEEK